MIIVAGFEFDRTWTESSGYSGGIIGCSIFYEWVSSGSSAATKSCVTGLFFSPFLLCPLCFPHPDYSHYTNFLLNLLLQLCYACLLYIDHYHLKAKGLNNLHCSFELTPGHLHVSGLACIFKQIISNSFLPVIKDYLKVLSQFIRFFFSLENYKCWLLCD